MNFLIHWVQIRLRAKRFARLREDYDIDRWLADIRDPR